MGNRMRNSMPETAENKPLKKGEGWTNSERTKIKSSYKTKKKRRKMNEKNVEENPFTTGVTMHGHHHDAGGGMGGKYLCPCA